MLLDVSPAIDQSRKDSPALRGTLPINIDVSAHHAPTAQSSKFTGKRVHFIGIGGCGMSGLARMLDRCRSDRVTAANRTRIRRRYRWPSAA